MTKSWFDRNCGRFASAFALVFVVFLAYGVTLLNGFVYDDNHQVLENPWITDVRNLPAIFTSSNWSFRSGGSNIYRPVFQTLLMAEYSVFGFNPKGYHLVNVLLHALNAVLVCAVAGRVLKGVSNRRIWAFAAGLIFALHPVNSEPVAWVSALPELTYTALVLSAFYLYASFTAGQTEGRQGPGYWLSVSAFFVALLTKETTVALVPIIVAFDFAKGRGVISGWRRYLPYLLAIVAYAVIRFYAIGGFMHRKHAAIGLYEAALNALPLLGQYFVKLVLPVRLSAVYVFYPAHSILEPRVIVSLIAIIVSIVVVIRLRRAGVFFLCAVWMAAPLAPVLYVPALAASPFAERYLYLPSAGFAVLIAYGLFGLYSRLCGGNVARARALAACAALALVVMGVSSGLRARVWESDLSLWSDAALKAPDSTHAHYNLGWLYHGAGDYDKAVSHYMESLRLDPSGADAHYNLGLIYLETRMPGEAAEEFRAALAIDPGYGEARRHLEALVGLNANG